MVNKEVDAVKLGGIWSSDPADELDGHSLFLVPSVERPLNWMLSPLLLCSIILSHSFI